MKIFILKFSIFSFFLCSTHISFGQTPPLGAVEDFVLFTAVGAFNNTGVSTVVVGDVGTNVGAFNAFPPGTLVGDIHVADPVSVLAAIDVEIAYNFLVAQTCGQVLSSGLGNGQILNPGIYCIGEASTINGNLVLDGQCNPDAVFIFQIDGALSTSTFSSVTFTNGASVCNVYWQVNGLVSLGQNSIFRGNIIANGALNLLENSSIFGRGLSRAGAISLSTNNVDIDQSPTPSIIMFNVGGPYCAGDSLILTGNCGGTWNTGSTGANLTVTQSGDYFVTNTNDCGSAISNHIIVNFNALPECNITGDLVICQGQSTELCVSGGASYLWSTGATTNCITAGTAGSYIVTITDVIGCTSVCSATVTVNPLPICTITGDNVICEGELSALCVSGGASYIWSTGATTDCITTGTAGNYSVTITDINGCTSVCNTTVMVNPLPTCTITGANIICLGASTQLCVSGGASYIWSTGATTDCITTGTAGNYSVTLTDINGCTSVCNTTVTVNPLPACTITGENIICLGASTQLCVSGGASYIWSTGATTDCITTGTAGNYSVTLTDINGCTSVCNRTVTVNPLPACTITGANVICLGASTQLCVSGGASYIWSTGATTDCITTGSAGNYSVTLTDINGCTSVCNTTVTVNPLPACTITGENVICLGASTQLCVSGGASYIWSTGATTDCITTGTAGNYSVTLTDINGCTSVCNTTVTVNPLPACTITGANIICLGASTQLCVSGGASYIWSTGATTDCITTGTAGNYSVTITDINGCTSVCNTTVTVNPLPACTITGANIICLGASTQLCVSGGASYIWSTGATTDCITTGTAGNYSVTLTDINGCTSVCNTTVTVNPLPACTITGANIICLGASTQLCVSGGASYIWSTGATTDCITTGTAGNYSVTLTDINGCTSVCNTTVTVNPLQACTITGANIICLGASTQLCVSGGASFIWSTGATTDCITTGTAGNYSVTLTDINGCTSVCNRTVIVNPLPACTITGANIICLGASTQLCVSGGASYIWTTGATTNCITTGTAGTYSVTITDVNGCTSVCNRTVIVNPLPVCTITGTNIICLGASTQLCVTGGSSYIWSTGATTDCITTGTAGTYSVTITDSNGCTSVCNRIVTVNPLPACTITGSDVICLGSSTQLCVSGGASYIWNTGATTDCISTGTAGTYSVTITDSNGCTSVCNRTVTVNPLPACTITGSDVICLGSSTQLCVSGGVSYIWTTGATTDCITAGTAGTYSVTITDSNGCTSVCSKTMVALTELPECFIVGDIYFCEGSSAEICGPTGPYTYLWSTGEVTRCISGDETGLYTLTITDANGCTSVCSRDLVETEYPVCEISGNTVICAGDSTQLCLPPGYYDYWWEDGQQTNCITVTEPGVYAITVTYIAGCQSICSTTVTLLTLPDLIISGNNIFCEGQSSVLCVSGNPESVIWSNGDTTNCITVVSTGTYSVTTTSPEGCSATSTMEVLSITGPVQSLIQANGNTDMCDGVPITLSGNVNGVWNTGETSPSIEVSTAGTYFVTNANSCDTVVSNQIVVTMSSSPVASVITNDSPTLICEGDIITLSGNVNGIWNTGETSASIDVSTAGTYFVTNANSCDTVVSNQIVITVNPLPAASIINSNVSSSICAGDTITLSGNVNGVWNTGATSPIIDVSTAGTYFVTNTNECGSVVSNQIVVTVNSLPVASIITSDTSTVICEGDTITLSGNVNGVWNTGETSPSIDVSTAGTYFVTNAYSCDTVYSNEIVVTVNPLPVASVILSDSSTVICPGDTITLSGNVGGVWNTGETSSSIEVSTAGTYFVTNTNECGSVVSNQIVVTEGTMPVASSINSGSSNEFCEGTTITLSGNVGGIWNTGETSPSIEVSSSGTYFVTNANECGAVISNLVGVIANEMPQCFISGNLNPEHNQTTMLCAPAGYKFYLWNTAEVTQCINVIASGYKSVTISNNEICFDSCEVLVVYKDVSGTNDSNLEEQFKLKISPNPFNLTSTIEFQNPFPDLDVTIDIYHISGVKVSAFKKFESTTQGIHSIVFDGNELEPGIYLCKINAGSFSFYKKMILLR
ncbi:MAG: DUF3494 domain-containing protein [Saprospiraceae bacterium]|nr:DUF3494 domain-containing protein [Saprospiraceae bacterium]